MGAFKDFFTWLLGPLFELGDRIAIDLLVHQIAVDQLDDAWNALRQERRDSPKVKAAYDARKVQLTAEGNLSATARPLGWLGGAVAGAIWAVTEKALPHLLTWIDEFKKGYEERSDHLEAMKAAHDAGTFGMNTVMGKDDLKALTDVASSGEFGLNAAMNFVLHTTLYPSVYAFGRPYWEDWRQDAWASHPSRVPSMSDLIRMEYREVFRPIYRQELILDEPISADFEKYAARAGFSKAQAENYWGAHWTLPGLTQGYDMYHRLRPAMQLDIDGNIVTSGGKYSLPATYSKPFELDDLNSLLKRQDVLKRYRDQLVQIAYKPFTRIDVRRMYRAGVMSFEEMIAAYLDAGYAPDKALKMAEFAKNWVTEGIEKRESKTGVLDAMKTGIITEDEAKSELATFYPDDVANRYVDVAKIKNKLNKAEVGKLLYAGEMDESEARDRFAEMGYPAADIDYLILIYSA